MRVLVACEESQAVTIELRKLGHEAFSCDLLDCSGGYPEWHIKGSALDQFDKGWDMMIAFPPCTDLAVSGAAWFEKKRASGEQQRSIEFFMKFVYAPIDKICIENPIGIMSGIYREPDQIIQPYEYGDKAQKSTCLWLKNLNLLQPTNIVSKGEFFEWTDKKTGKTKRQPKWFYDAFRFSTTPEQRSTLRSKTFPGIAKAMADQFTKPLRQYKLF
ncbi:MAG: DNA cytosine methyltransferase [Gammaproteobacteria bacterium]|nr:DNA cytosine methyltransferase [Gammaproteobacteria bacterium]